MPEAATLIQATGLVKAFGAQRVLDGVDLTVRAGETVVILGPSGTGKSVLLKHFVGLLRPDAGTVRVHGQDVAALSPRALTELRTEIGVVFQSAALFDSMTVFDNVAFPLRAHRRDLGASEVRQRVEERLAALGLPDVGGKYPSELSGGMKKRVGLARAVILAPKIVLYDEPTTGLDPITAVQVDDMIDSSRSQFGVTNVVISHDISSAFRIADRIAFLYRGRVVVTGPPQTVRDTDHPYVAQFLRSWFAKDERMPS